MKLKDKRHARGGFTLVELLVVIAIIGILVALLLPAVQAAREAARRSQCQSQMKNVALALLNYHDTNGEFPPGFRVPDGEAAVLNNQGLGDGSQLYANWSVMVLPFIEEQSLFDTAALNDLLSRPANRQIRESEISVMLCPSEGGQGNPAILGNNTWARGNYGLNLGLGYIQQVTDVFGDWKKPCGRGVAWVNRGVKMSQVTDGTSNTIALAEMRIGIVSHDFRGVWAMPLIGSNAHQRHASNFVLSPNDCNPGTDDIFQNPAQRLLDDPGEQALLADCMGVSTFEISAQSTVRSRHPGGAMCGFVDGSVHFISDFVDSGDPVPNYVCERQNMGVWQTLNSSNDDFVNGEY